MYMQAAMHTLMDQMGFLQCLLRQCLLSVHELRRVLAGAPGTSVWGRLSIIN